MAFVDLRRARQRIARMQVERHVELLALRPEPGVARIIKVDRRVRIADLREAVDERAAEAELLHRARQLARRGVGILHGERGEPLEALGALRHLAREEIVCAARHIGGPPGIGNGLDGGRVEGQDHHLHAVAIHLGDAPLLQVHQPRLELRPGRVGEETFRIRKRVRNGEMLFEPNLALHGRLLRWHLNARGGSMNPQGQAGSTSDATYDPAVALQFFKSAGKSVNIAEGEKIFEENERAIPLLRRQKMYLLLKGEVSLMSGLKTIGRVRPGEVFGEMAVISDAPRSASAVAKTASRVITLDDKEFEAALGKHPEFALMLMSVMIFRLRNTIAQLKNRDALSEDAGLKESVAFDPQVLADLVQGLADDPPIF